MGLEDGVGVDRDGDQKGEALGDQEMGSLFLDTSSRTCISTVGRNAGPRELLL